MGTICKVFKNEKHISWQAKIRRVGIPSFSLSFNTYEQAADWLNENEEKYIYEHRELTKKTNRLELARKRKKERTGKI